MTLSLESIHKPLNDFFLSKFQTNNGSSVQFRFNQAGSVLSDEDFIDPHFPEQGYSANLAKEKFSDIVNRIPVDYGDGLNIILSQDSVDDTYFFRLLAPSTTVIPNNSFNMTKESALKRWNEVTLESSSGVMLEYKPTIATPVNWYNKAEIWPNQSFQITDANSASPSNPSHQLWRLKLDDASMVAVLNSSTAVKTTQTNPTSNLMAHSRAIDSNSLVAARPEQRNFNRNAGGAGTRDGFSADEFDLHELFRTERRGWSVRDHLRIEKVIAEKAQTRPVQTNNIQISFDYRLVEATRDWYFEQFIYDESWNIPNTPKGQLTLNSVAGSLPWLPIGFVAIRNLNIEGSWTEEDMEYGVQALNLGPFEVTGSIVDGHLKLEKTDLQIIGWLLQRLPELPPNDPPA